MLVKKNSSQRRENPIFFLKNVEMLNVSDFKKMSGREKNELM